MIIFDIAASFAAALLTGLGIGSGGIFIIYLTMIKSVNQLEAQGLNLVFFLAASVSALIINLKKRNLRLRLILIMAVCGTAGALTGSLAVSFIPADLLRKIFGFFLISAGAISFFRK